MKESWSCCTWCPTLCQGISLELLVDVVEHFNQGLWEGSSVHNSFLSSSHFGCSNKLHCLRDFLRVLHRLNAGSQFSQTTLNLGAWGAWRGAWSWVLCRELKRVQDRAEGEVRGVGKGRFWGQQHCQIGARHCFFFFFFLLRMLKRVWGVWFGCFILRFFFALFFVCWWVFEILSMTYVVLKGYLYEKTVLFLFY